MSTPNWTDIIQAIASIIAIPGAIAAFVILFRKDKNRESEIKSLSEIAGQLTMMFEASENRYKSTKKPHMEIKLDHFEVLNMFTISFKNTNLQSTLNRYKYDVNEEIVDTKYSINEVQGKQTFKIDLKYSNLPDFINLNIDYTTDDNYTFIQDIFIVKKAKQYGLSTSAIIDKTKSPLYSNK